MIIHITFQEKILMDLQLSIYKSHRQVVAVYKAAHLNFHYLELFLISKE